MSYLGLKRKRSTPNVIPFPKGGKDGKPVAKKVEVEKPKPKPKPRPQRVLSQREKDLVRIESLLTAGKETDIDWQYAADFIVNHDLILDWSVVDALLKNHNAPWSVKRFLVGEFSKELHCEFSRCKGQFGKWHHDNARRLLRLVSWIIYDDLRYVNEVERLRALYSAHDSSFPDSMEHHVREKLDNIARKAVVQTPVEEPVRRRKKSSKPKPRLSAKQRAKLKATRKEREAARKAAKRANKGGDKGKGKGKGKGKK